MNRESGSWRLVSINVNLWVEKVSTPSSVDYMPNISTDTRTPIDGNKLTVTGTGGVYSKSQTSIFTY